MNILKNTAALASSFTVIGVIIIWTVILMTSCRVRKLERDVEQHTIEIQQLQETR